MTSLCFLVFSFIHLTLFMAFTKCECLLFLQKGLMKMLLLKLIGYAFGILILVAVVCMIAAIIMATFDESKHD